MDRVVVYGLGTIGIEIVDYMKDDSEELEIEIVALIDKAVNGEFGLPLFRPENLPKLHYDYVLVTTEKYYEEIRCELMEKYAISSEKIILWKDWVSDRGNKRCYCNLCMHFFPFMLKYGCDSSVFLTKKIIGGGIRNSALCPFCNSIDRDRWIQYALENWTEIYRKPLEILHFGPEPMIEAKIRKKKHVKYITADIEPGRADEIVDITDIAFPDNSFDYIICNHVLEHIREEEKALSEMRRCLKQDGAIIFSVPICWEQKTEEDYNVSTAEQRLLEYGQEDHVRLYGNDLKERLEKSGFTTTMYRVEEELSSEQIMQMSLIPEDTVWILKKKSLSN